MIHRRSRATCRTATMAGSRLASMEIPGAAPIRLVTAAIAVRDTDADIDGQPPFISPEPRIGLRDSRRGMTINLNKGRVG